MTSFFELDETELGRALDSGNYQPFLQPVSISTLTDEHTLKSTDLLVTAIALRELGYRTNGDWPERSERENDVDNASRALSHLSELPLDEAWRMRVEIESTRLATPSGAVRKLTELEAAIPTEKPESRSLLATLRLVRAIAGVNARELDTVISDFEFASNTFLENEDLRLLAESRFQYGRFRAWQGREDLANPLLDQSMRYWIQKNNKVMAAHVRYQLADLWIDLRKFEEALDQLSIVVSDYESNMIAPAELARAKQRTADALIYTGRLAEAEKLLHELRNTGATNVFRQQMVLKNFAEIAILQAKTPDPQQRAGALERASKYVEEAFSLFGKQRNDDSFELLILRGLLGEIIALDQRHDEVVRLAGVDLIVRSAVGFADAPRERPHEVRLRLAAVGAYLDILQSASDTANKEITRALGFQVEKLNDAAGKIGLSLGDAFAQATLAKSQEYVSVASTDVSEQSEQDMTLLELMSQTNSRSSMMEVFARLVEALRDQYELGLKPTNFRPSEVIVRAGGFPIIRTHSGEDSNRKITSSDHAFMAPELVSRRTSAQTSDFYTIGALVFEWMQVSPPANSGRKFWLHLQRFTRTLSRRTAVDSTELHELASELTAINPKNRPSDPYSIAARLRSLANR